MDRKLLNDREAAAYLGQAVQTLRNWRWTGKGPEFYKYPTGNIFYDVQDLEAFLADAKRRAAGQPVGLGHGGEK